MHPARLGATCALGAALLTACGGGSSAPTTPTSPTAPTDPITITSQSDQLLIGVSETFTASGLGTASSWSSDSSAATVEAGTGRVTGNASGEATIAVDSGGRRGTKLIRVLPNYQGTWSGSYRVTECSQTEQMARANFCGNSFEPTTVLPMSMTNTQTRDAVTSRLALGTIAGDGSGPVRSDGTLLLEGTVRSGDLSIDTNWNLQSAQAGRITGSANHILRSRTLTGEVRMSVNVRDLNRTSNITAETASRGNGPAVRTLADILPALLAVR
jgi:hypothetical protein